MKTPIVTVCAGIAGWFAAFATRPAPIRPVASAVVSVAPSVQPVAGAESVSTAQVIAPEKPIIDRFSDAMKLREPFATSVKLVAIVDGMTAADFEQFLARPKNVPSAAGMGFDDKIGEAFIEILVARWLEVNPAGALAQIKQLEKSLITGERSRWIGSGDYFKALARVNPRMLLDDTDWVNDPKTDAGLVPRAFEMLARTDPAAARKYLERVQPPSLRKEVSRAIANGVAHSDPAAAAAIARAEGDEHIFQSALRAASKRGAADLRAVLQINDRKFPIGSQLAELVMRFPDEDWTHFAPDSGKDERSLYGVTREVAELRARMSPEEQRAMLDKVQNLPQAAQNTMIAAFFFPWAKTNPREAMDWAMKQKGLWDEDKSPAGYPFGEWARADRSAALSWLAAQPESISRDNLSGSLSLALAHDGELDEAMRLFQAERQPQEKISTFASSVAKHDPERAAKWIATLPPRIDASRAATSIAVEWAEKDPGKAAQWVESLTAETQRDAAVAGFAGTILARDVTAAAEWVGTIRDGGVREKAAGTVFSYWLSRDPFAARRWLQALPGIDEIFRARLLRRGRQ